MGKRKPDAYDLAHPDFPDATPIVDLARIAVEFDYHPRTERIDAILAKDPPSRGFWTVHLGRLALRRDGKWAYRTAGRPETARDRQFVRMQWFITLEEAVRVATKVFGREPEHAGWMRSLYEEKEDAQ